MTISNTINGAFGDKSNPSLPAGTYLRSELTKRFSFNIPNQPYLAHQEKGSIFANPSLGGSRIETGRSLQADGLGFRCTSFIEFNTYPIQNLARYRNGLQTHHCKKKHDGGLLDIEIMANFKEKKALLGMSTPSNSVLRITARTEGKESQGEYQIRPFRIVFLGKSIKATPENIDKAFEIIERTLQRGDITLEEALQFEKTKYLYKPKPGASADNKANGADNDGSIKGGPG